MDEETENLYKQLANDLKVLANINAGILFNKKYMNLVGPSIMKNLERAENHLDKMRSDLETRYLMKDPNKDIVNLYKTINKDEKVQEMINRLEKY